MEQFDAIVVGGGPAGSTTASFLAQMGHRVVLLEKAHFPRHHVGESMISATIDLLSEIGLEEKLAAANFPVKSGGCFIWGSSNVPWCIRFDEVPGRRTSYQVKRDVFDQILLQHAASLGVDVREGHRVVATRHIDDRVVGVQTERADGGTAELRAPYTVDASGLAGVVGRDLTSRLPIPELDNIALYGYWRGAHPPPVGLGGEIREIDRNNIIVRWLDPGWLWFIPLGHGQLISVGYVAPRSALPTTRNPALQEVLLDKVRTTPEFRYLLSHAEYTGEFHTIRDWSYRRSAMSSPGQFSVGDAACFVDPILSTGVYFAVLHAKMCAIGINTCLQARGREPVVREWYEGLYADAFDDYMQMARFWYAGSGEASEWMHHARVVTPGGTSLGDTDRAAFIGLATGNIHAYTNYVPIDMLPSLGCPARLTKDRGARVHHDGHAILQRRASAGGSSAIRAPARDAMASPESRRGTLRRLMAQRDVAKDSFSVAIEGVPLKEDGALALAENTRVFVEVIENLVTVVVTNDRGERRRLNDEELSMLNGLVRGQPVRSIVRASEKPAAARAFLAELIAAGVAVGRHADGLPL